MSWVPLQHEWAAKQRMICLVKTSPNSDLGIQNPWRVEPEHGLRPACFMRRVQIESSWGSMDLELGWIRPIESPDVVWFVSPANHEQVVPQLWSMALILSGLSYICPGLPGYLFCVWRILPCFPAPETRPCPSLCIHIYVTCCYSWCIVVSYHVLLSNSVDLASSIDDEDMDHQTCKAVTFIVIGRDRKEGRNSWSWAWGPFSSKQIKHFETDSFIWYRIYL